MKICAEIWYFPSCFKAYTLIIFWINNTSTLFEFYQSSWLTRFLDLGWTHRLACLAVDRWVWHESRLACQARGVVMQSSWASGSGHDSYSTLRAAYYSPPRPNRYNRTSLSQLHNPHSTAVDPPGSHLQCGTAGMHTYTAFSERIYKQIRILRNYIFLHRHCKCTICLSQDGYSHI